MSSFVLQYKEPYIVKTEMLKNRTHQSYRWKDTAIADSREPLEEYISKQKMPGDWRIEPRLHATPPGEG